MKPVLRADSVTDDSVEKNSAGKADLDRSGTPFAPFWTDWSKIRPANMVLVKHTYKNVLFWLMALSMPAIKYILEF